MAIIPRLIARYALVLYALSALGALFYVWAALQSRRKEELALFTMERESAVHQGMRAWLMAGLCVLLALGVYGVSNYVVPNLPPDQADATPMIGGFLITSTATQPPPPAASVTLTPPTATRGPVPTVAPIATPLVRPPDTPTSAAEGEQAALDAACTSAGTQIVAPRNGDRLWGLVEVRGTASLPDFSFYKFEIQWPDSDEWVTLQSFDVPVAGGILGHWDTTPLEPGTYKFRLVVVDNTSNFPDPCVITVVIEPPTPEG